MRIPSARPVCAPRLRAPSARPVCAPRLRAPSGAPSAETLKITVFRPIRETMSDPHFSRSGNPSGSQPSPLRGVFICVMLGAQQPWPTRKEDKGSFHEPPAQQCKLTRTKGMGDRPGWLEGLGVEARENLVFWNFRRERASKRDLPNPSSESWGLLIHFIMRGSFWTNRDSKIPVGKSLRQPGDLRNDIQDLCAPSKLAAKQRTTNKRTRSQTPKPRTPLTQ